VSLRSESWMFYVFESNFPIMTYPAVCVVLSVHFTMQRKTRLTNIPFFSRRTLFTDSLAWNLGSKPIRDLLKIRYGTENVVRTPKSKVSKGDAATGARSSGVSSDGIMRVIKLEKASSSSVLNPDNAGDRVATRDASLDANPSIAVVAPSAYGGDQSDGGEEDGDSDTRQIDGTDSRTSDAGIAVSQAATEACWGDDIDEEGREIQSEREMKEFWENRFNEQGARGKRLNEIRCAYEVMSAAGELRLTKTENGEQDDGLSGGENSGEEMDEE
jgi:hypothetical protein